MLEDEKKKELVDLAYNNLKESLKLVKPGEVTSKELLRNINENVYVLDKILGFK